MSQYSASASSTIRLVGSSPPMVAATTRVRRGDTYRATIGPGRADTVPVAVVTGPGGVTLGVYRMPVLPRPSGSVYLLEFRIPGGVALGTYLVTCSYSVGGTAGAMSSSFDVVPGGDSGGRVISLFCHDDRPEARYVLAQLDSGQLVQGRNPHL